MIPIHQHPQPVAHAVPHAQFQQQLAALRQAFPLGVIDGLIRSAQHCLPELYGYPDDALDPQHESFRAFLEDFSTDYSDLHDVSFVNHMLAHYLAFPNVQARNLTFSSIGEYLRCAFELLGPDDPQDLNPQPVPPGRYLPLLTMANQAYLWFLRHGDAIPVFHNNHPIQQIESQHQNWTSDNYVQHFLNLLAP